MKSRLLILAIMLSLAWVVYYFIDLLQIKQLKVIHEVESGSVISHVDEAESVMKVATLRFEEARKKLESGDLMKSFEAFHKGRSEVAIHLNQHGGREVGDGKTMNQWYDEEIKSYKEGMTKAYPLFLDGLKKGKSDPGEVKDLANYFSSDGIPELKEMYAKNLNEIKKSRVRLAPEWFRLHVYGVDKDFLELAKGKIADRLKAAPGIKLVIGNFMGPEEQRATWKALSVPVNIENAQYHFEGLGQNTSQFVQPEIPKSVKIEFKLVGAKEVLTNWDKIDPISAKIEVPDSILLKEGSNGEAQAQGIAQKHRQELLSAFGEAIDALPKLVLFPGIDVETAPMVKDGSLDRQAVMAIAYADRKRVLADLTVLAEEGVESSHGDVAWLAVVLGMEELSGFVADKLPDLDRKTQSEVLRKLALRPHYGDFGPLLEAISRIPDQQPPPQLAIQALSGHLDVKKVKDTFLEKVKDRSITGRQVYLQPLIRSLNKEELEALIPVWLIDNDENFARQAWANFRNLDEKLAVKQMNNLFPKVSAGVQQAMLQGFRYNESNHSAELLEILKTASFQEKNADIQRSAVNILTDASHIPEVWDFLNDYVKKENDSRKVEQIKGRLIFNLRRAHPDEADEFLLRWLEDESGQVKFATVMAMLDQDDDKKEKLQLLADKLNSKQDPDILRGTVQAAHQFWKIRKGWEAEHLYDSLSEVLKLGVGGSDADVKKKAQTVISRAVADGDVRYGDLLK